MHCFFCKGDIRSGTKNHVVNHKDSVIVIKKVPCTECTQCGNAYYDDYVMEQIELIVDNMRKAVAEVAVVSYNHDMAA
jgi:YgiT-type zinc finger domain-containing protein